VLFSEIAILYNEDNKRKQLERAARSGGRGKDGDASSAGGKKAARDASGGRLVDEMSGEINTGRLETNTNPLFLNASGDGAKAGGAGAAGGAGGLSVDVVMAQRTSPPAELWSLFQNEYAAMAAQVEASKQQVLEARKAAASGSSGAGGGAGDGDDDAGGKPGSARKAAKAEFVPRAAGSDGSSSAVKSMLLKKKSSKSAQAF
jgi:hypothetical protein